jgi:hypothetical protein
MLYKMPISGFESIFTKLREWFEIISLPREEKKIFHSVFDTFAFLVL